MNGRAERWTITGEGTFTLTPLGEQFFAELQGELAERDKPVITIREFDEPTPSPASCAGGCDRREG